MVKSQTQPLPEIVPSPYYLSMSLTGIDWESFFIYIFFPLASPALEKKKSLIAG